MKPTLAILALAAVAASVSSQNMEMGGMDMNMPGMDMNFNLSTLPGILGFLRMERINPQSLVTSNCIANGNPCSPSGGRACCLSPVFSCQGTSQGENACMVVDQHADHLMQIREIVRTFGVSTMRPIL